MYFCTQLSEFKEARPRPDRPTLLEDHDIIKGVYFQRKETPEADDAARRAGRGERAIKKYTIMEKEIIAIEWETLPIEERKRRIAVREATSLMMQGTITCEKYGVYANS